MSSERVLHILINFLTPFLFHHIATVDGPRTGNSGLERWACLGLIPHFGEPCPEDCLKDSQDEDLRLACFSRAASLIQNGSPTDSRASLKADDSRVFPPHGYTTLSKCLVCDKLAVATFLHSMDIEPPRM